MSALAWLGVGALVVSALYVIAGEMVRDAVDHALYAAHPSDDDWLGEVVGLGEAEVRADEDADLIFQRMCFERWEEAL